LGLIFCEIGPPKRTPHPEAKCWEMATTTALLFLVVGLAAFGSANASEDGAGSCAEGKETCGPMSLLQRQTTLEKPQKVEVSRDHSVVKCGIASSVNECEKDMSYLRGIDAVAATRIDCMGYGGAADPCTLNVHNDPAYGMDKDPSLCRQDVFWLWDEPHTQGKSASWAGRKWNEYADKWSSQLMARKNAGMKIVSPLVTGGETKGKVTEFFRACGARCDQR